jgi:signal transduction histidine kinase
VLLGFSLPAAHSGDDSVSYVARVARAVDGRRLAAVALVTLLLSLGPLFRSDLVEFFSPTELVLAWFEHLVELVVLAAALTAAYTLLDEALPRRMPLRVGVLCAMLFGLSTVLTLLLYAYYAHGFDNLPPPLRLLADSLRFGLPAVFITLIADVHQRALQVDSAAHAAEVLQIRLGHDESEQQLALLQAQIEPHFLFNVLGAVRRLYRTRPEAGSDTIASLMRYLRAALPQLRRRSACLGDEFELVRAYLDLFQIRMGARLTFSIAVDPTLHEVAFPPMLLITLVENAIKHGLEPAGGGEVVVRARRTRNMLEVAVLDDGAGFGAAATGGTGVGLANVRRQLAARYKRQARLTLEARAPRGASATILIPLRAATAGDSGRWRKPTAV